jgi:hypothetical protein
LAVVYQPIPMILSESALCVGSEVPIVPYLISGTPAFAETLGQGLVVL